MAETTDSGIIKIGHYRTAEHRLEVSRFGEGLRLRIDGRSDLYINADGTSDGSGTVINPAWREPKKIPKRHTVPLPE